MVARAILLTVFRITARTCAEPTTSLLNRHIHSILPCFSQQYCHIVVGSLVVYDGLAALLFVLQVLVEGVNPKMGNQAYGRTTQNKICFFDGDGLALKSKLVNIKVEEIRAYTLSGHMV